jgi:hypothetical protein
MIYFPKPNTVTSSYIYMGIVVQLHTFVTVTLPQISYMYWLFYHMGRSPQYPLVRFSGLYSLCEHWAIKRKLSVPV